MKFKLSGNMYISVNSRELIWKEVIYALIFKMPKIIDIVPGNQFKFIVRESIDTNPSRLLSIDIPHIRAWIIGQQLWSRYKI